MLKVSRRTLFNGLKSARDHDALLGDSSRLLAGNAPCSRPKPQACPSPHRTPAVGHQGPSVSASHRAGTLIPFRASRNPQRTTEPATPFCVSRAWCTSFPFSHR